MRTYKLYQLKKGDENHYHRFVGLDMLKSDGLKVEFNRYNKMYEGILFPGETLESLFVKFNMDRPDDFSGWSMSVSDVVVITEDGKAKAFYCDSYGFTEVPEFLNDKKRKHKE